MDLIAKEQVRMVYRDGSIQTETLEVLRECNAEVFLNDRPILQLTCVAEHLQALVVGRLYTEGWIDSAADLTALEIGEGCIRVSTAVDRAEPRVRTAPIASIPWTKEQVFQLADAFGAGSPLHRRTWSTHSAFLARDGEILFFCEDIGRHNALDKAIGFGLLHGIDLSRSILFTSGRVPTDMVRKIIQAGVPILCSKGAATDKSIALGKAYGLTMLCSVRRDSFRILY